MISRVLHGYTRFQSDGPSPLPWPLRIPAGASSGSPLIIPSAHSTLFRSINQRRRRPPCGRLSNATKLDVDVGSLTGPRVVGGAAHSVYGERVNYFIQLGRMPSSRPRRGEDFAGPFTDSIPRPPTPLPATAVRRDETRRSRALGSSTAF